jgi:hypothetical protein
MLTKPQTKLLEAVKAAGSLRCSSRKRRPIEALRKAGLVEFDLVVQPDALRGRHMLKYIVRPTGKEERR